MLMLGRWGNAERRGGCSFLQEVADRSHVEETWRFWRSHMWLVGYAQSKHNITGRISGNSSYASGRLE